MRKLDAAALVHNAGHEAVGGLVVDADHVKHRRLAAGCVGLAGHAVAADHEWGHRGPCDLVR